MARPTLLRFVLCALVWLASATAAGASPLRERDLLDFLTDQVAVRYQVPTKGVEITWDGASLASLVRGALPTGHLTYAVTGQPRMLGHAAVPIALSVDGKLVRTIYPRVLIRVWQDVWVATEPMHRGSLFDPAWAKRDRRSLDTLMGAPAKEVADLKGATLKREVPSGTVLVDEMFELPSLVHSGSMVSVKLVSGDLVIVTQGQVIGNGAMGQLVKVINPDSHREYVARVVGNDQVEVHVEEAP